MNLKENPAVIWLAAAAVLLVAIAAIAAQTATPWPVTLIGVAGLIVASALVVGLLLRAGVAWSAAAAFAIAAGTFALSAFYLPADRHFGFVTGLALALAAVFATAALVRASEVLHRQERLRAALGGAMPETTIRHLAREPRLIAPAQRSVTYLHAQYSPSTAMAETAIVAGAQAFLRSGTEAVVANMGTVDRRVAGSFGGFWNAPLDDTGAAVHACAAALALLGHGGGRENEVAAPGYRVGIARTGAVAASFGNGALAYSVLGACVDQAAALAAMAGRYGYGALTDAAVAKDAAHAFALLQVDDEPAPVYALLGDSAVRTGPKFRALQTFHEHIFAALKAREWRKAQALIEQCRKLSGASQPLYDLHLARITERERPQSAVQTAAAISGAASP